MLNKSAIKYIQSLQHKKNRDEYHVFVAEGPKLVAELMASGVFKCQMICAISEWISTHKDLLKSIPEKDVYLIEPYELEKISSLATPNQVVGVFGKEKNISASVYDSEIILVLDRIQDPGNLGTIIRTADWFGIRKIICSPDTADVYNPKVIQSTMASLARVEVNYTELLPWLKAQVNIPIYAMMLEGQSVVTVKQKNPAIIIIGNEANGITESLLFDGVIPITIPGNSETESLNAAVAASIVMYEFSS